VSARGAGLGSRLLDEIDEELEPGITEVMVGLMPGNDGAQRLYERRGFKPRWLMLARRSA
jgi:ribosomal protein S18 acetylase RimI-like enzyme